MLCDLDNKAGFRDYDWQDYKFLKQGVWDSFDELEDLKEERRERKRQYLKQAGITDSAYGAENLNYIIIKYTHGLRRPINDEYEDKPLTANQFHAARAEGNESSVYTSDMALTTDGRFKFKIDFDNPVYHFRLYKFNIRLELKGTAQSPEAVLYIDNSPQKEPLLEITYWGINHVTLHTYKNDVYTGEFLYIYGELTSK